MERNRETDEHLRALDLPRPVLGRSAWERSCLEHLAALARTGEPCTAPYLGRFLQSPPALVAEAAAAAIHALLWQVPPQALVALDRSARSLSAPRSNLSPTQVRRWAADPAHGAGVAALASLDRDGHVREEAIAGLRRSAEAPALGFLLLRANDWVEPVRKAALAVLGERLTPAFAAQFLAHAPLRVARAQDSRGKGDGLSEAVGQLLARPECRPEVSAALRAGPRPVGRSALRLVTRAQGATADLVALAPTSKDGGLRLETLLHGLPTVPAADRRMLLRRALTDPMPRVRCVALDAWALEAEDAEDREAVLRGFLLDRSHAMRERARWHLGWREGDRAASWYRGALAGGDPRTRAVALRGLSETGTTEDAPRVQAHLRDERTSVRRSALLAWARLDPRGAAEHLTEFLASPAKGLARTARDLLLRHRPVPSLEAIQALARAHPDPDVRRRALEVLIAQPPWAVLADLLRSGADQEPSVAALAATRLEDVVRRLNRGCAAVSRSELDRVGSALSEVRERLAPQVACQLEFILRTTTVR